MDSLRGLSGESRPTLLIPFVVAFAVLGSRAQINVGAGGQGMLPIVTIVAPIVAAVTVIRYGTGRSLRFMANPLFALTMLPYLMLTGVLPILGVMFHGFPERTLLSSSAAITAFSLFIVGAAISSAQRSWAPWLLVAILLQLIYAAGQALFLVGGPGAELFAPFHDWDLSLYGQLVQARSSGLYLNPNVLGLWAGVAVILSWTLLPPRARGFGITIGLMTLLLSQSRGAAVALIAALVSGAAMAAVRPRLSTGALRTALTFGFAGLLAVSLAIAITPPGALDDRFGALFDVLADGPRAESNLSARLDLWSTVTVLNSVYPFGTWGTPELVLGTTIDSSWFRAFAQGSLPYVATLVLLFVGALAVGRSYYGIAIRPFAILVAVAGVTQLPLNYPVMDLFWVLLGAALQYSTRDRVTIPAAVPGTQAPVGASAHERSLP